MVNGEPITMIMYGSGYGNTTSAVDAIQFKMSAGNIDAGTITLYGIS
jgi:flavodoxin